MCNRGNDSDREELFKIVPTYSLPTKMGFWYNRTALEEAKKNFMNYKRAHCQLLVGKTRNMLRNVLEPVKLATAIENILYDDYYQIFASELSNPLDPTSQTKGLYLAGLINERDIDQGIEFMHGCSVTASPQATSCKRNTFRFLSAENNTGAINYGEELYIQIYNDDKSSALYLQAEYSTIDTFGDHIYARLSAVPDVYCHFKLLNRQPKLRKASLGSKVLPRNNLIIQHVASGRNLAAEIQKWIPTFFGPECTVSCHTFQNVNRVETAENIWQIVGKKELDKGMMIRAAKGENIPPELLE